MSYNFGFTIFCPKCFPILIAMVTSLLWRKMQENSIAVVTDWLSKIILVIMTARDKRLSLKDFFYNKLRALSLKMTSMNLFWLVSLAVEYTYIHISIICSSQQSLRGGLYKILLYYNHKNRQFLFSLWLFAGTTVIKLAITGM